MRRRVRTPRSRRRNGPRRYPGQDSEQLSRRQRGSHGSCGCGQTIKIDGRRTGNLQQEADWPIDSPGSYRSNGGFPSQPGAPHGNDRRDRPSTQGRAAISADTRTAERENTSGGWLKGFDRRLKGDDRLKEKVAGGLSTTSPEATPEQVLREVPDAIRYTFCLPAENYVRGYYDIKARLASFGHEMYQSKNSGTATEYKGINTRWVTQEGQRFEVQFHTSESFHAKQNVTHSAYKSGCETS